MIRGGGPHGTPLPGVVRGAPQASFAQGRPPRVGGRRAGCELAAGGARFAAPVFHGAAWQCASFACHATHLATAGEGWSAVPEEACRECGGQAVKGYQGADPAHVDDGAVAVEALQ